METDGRYSLFIRNVGIHKTQLSSHRWASLVLGTDQPPSFHYISWKSSAWLIITIFSFSESTQVNSRQPLSVIVLHDEVHRTDESTARSQASTGFVPWKRGYEFAVTYHNISLWSKEYFAFFQKPETIPNALTPVDPREPT